MSFEAENWKLMEESMSGMAESETALLGGEKILSRVMPESAEASTGAGVWRKKNNSGNAGPRS